MKISSINHNTIKNCDKIFTYSNELRDYIIELAYKSYMKRSRICLHDDLKSLTQEMILCLTSEASIERHFHPASKHESYHVLEGTLYVDIYDKNDTVAQTVEIGPKDGLYWQRGGVKHRPYCKEGFCIYHEVFYGPFNKEKDVLYF